MYKSDFPLFTKYPELIYLDSAATTQKLGVVIDAVADFSRAEYATIHRGLYPLSVAATEKYEHVRESVAKFIGSENPCEIVFTRGATEGLNLLAHGLSERLQPGDEIIISELEHHANLVPWLQIPQVTVKFVPITSTGDIDLEVFKNLISEKTKVVSFSLCSNVLGSITPIPRVREILQQQGSRAILIADAAQAVPHFPVSVTALGVDALVFSGHKLYGPSGTGVLWGRMPFLESLPPYQTGGDMIKTVTKEGATWNDVPWKFEAGTPNIEGIIGLGAAITYLEQVGMEQVARHTAEITMYGLEQLRALPGATLVGNTDPTSGIISFVIDGIHPHDVAEALGEQQVCIRAGHHCAAPLHDSLGLTATNRLSIGLYTTKGDIDAAMHALTATLAFFRRV